MKILVTGASGFIGSAVVNQLASGFHEVRSAVRPPARCYASKVEEHFIEGLTSQQDWSICLEDVDVVVHCAARVHVMNERQASPLNAFRSVNVEGTRRLAEQAALAGAKRIVFLSSIKVNGEKTDDCTAFRSSDIPAPVDPYGISKREAEDAIRQVCAETGMEYVIIRPVLVYGPGVKANFADLISLVSKGIPLPVGAAKNNRSFVALDNLVDLIATCIESPAAANQTFLASDAHDLSTAELVRAFARSMNRNPRIIWVPPFLLKLGAKLLRREAVADRLLGSLQVDISHTCKVLNWKPPVSVFDALQKTVDSFPRR